jgi:hypothetical protein
LAMLRYAKLPAVQHYRVEVSGWDRSQNFFVENCDLLWAEGGKIICLRQDLPPSAILFVRLLDPTQTDHAHPVVYEAKWTGKTVAGASEFQLTGLAPGVRTSENSLV